MITQPAWFRSPILIFCVKAQAIAQSSAKIAPIEIVSLDPSRFQHVAAGSEAVSSMYKIPTGFLRNAALWEGLLIVPVVLDGGGGGAAAGSLFGEAAVRGEVDVALETGGEFGHSCVIA